MESGAQRAGRTARRSVVAASVAALVLGVTACGHVFGTGVQAPARSEFGVGPRTSAKQLYRAALEPAGALRLRQLQTVPVRIVDASGRPVDGAVLSVDGGMPQHGHGLPTQPKIGRALGGGVYEIEGLRFSMGGWWELKLAIDAPAGVDAVTFNLDL